METVEDNVFDSEYLCASTDEHTSASLSSHMSKRLLLLEKLNKDVSLQRLFIQVCADDPVFFINNFLYTNYPRNPNGLPNCPFVLYNFQEWAIKEFHANIEQGEDFLIEKSREMGASWIISALFTWYFLFREDFTGHLGSYKADYVDRGGPDPNTLMGRVVYMLERLPVWMKPTYERKENKITNTQNNAIITGETSTTDFGRSARYMVVLLDEHAFWPNGQSSFDACRSSAHCRIVLSTPNGEDNSFYRIRTEFATEYVEHPLAYQMALDKGLVDAGIPF
jgi:phage terminase large subunit